FDTVGTRIGPLPTWRPLDPLARVSHDLFVLVASGRLVGKARTARGGGTMLRRLGGLGASERGAMLRAGARGNRGLSVRGPTRAAGGGQRIGPRLQSEEEGNDDYEGEYAQIADLGGERGTIQPGDRDVALATDVGARSSQGHTARRRRRPARAGSA